MNSPWTLIQALMEVLHQGRSLLEQSDDETYIRKVPLAFNASIGGHYRHCLEHVESALASLDADELNYDQRKRDLRIETNRSFALATTCRLLAGAESLSEEMMQREVRVRCKVSYGTEESPTAVSTFGREIMFATTHAVHHYALIGVICGVMQVPVPPGFGIAPSTIKHQEEMAQIPSV
jgi:hypothetical protein